jgi:small-conductance mechanosensitive channel
MRNQLREEQPEMDQDKQRENRNNSETDPLSISPNGRVISYNVPEGERPGGIKVRFKIRIATGKRAQEIDARQAKVIMEVLQWQRQQRTGP